MRSFVTMARSAAHTLAVFFVLQSSSAWAVDLERVDAFDIPAQPLPAALLQFSRQAKVQVLTATKDLQDYRSEAVNGRLSLKDALARLLGRSQLEYRVSGANSIIVGRGEALKTIGDQQKRSDAPGGMPPAGPILAQAGNRPEPGPAPSLDSSLGSTAFRKGIVPLPEIVVTGTKILNMDIRRSQDDAQPYVIFDRDTISQSGVRSLEEFFKQRLPMNTQAQSFSQVADSRGNVSQINLRGLGTDQTLILIDGHRLSSVAPGGAVQQPDLNGIPIAAIERIEVLPTTASGIYGGSATGGVINVILRRDYSGVGVAITYGSSSKGDSATRRIDANAGIELEGGKTNILLATSYSDDEGLLVGQRDLVQRGRARILENNPGFYARALTPPLGFTTNIRSADGSNLVLRNGTMLNSPITSVPIGYEGTGTDRGQGLAANAGRYNLDLADSTQGFGGSRQGMINGPTVASALVTARRSMSNDVDVFLDFFLSKNEGEFPSRTIPSYVIPASAPNNPFTQAIRVTFPGPGVTSSFLAKNEDRRAIVGVILKLPAKWLAEADYTRSLTKFMRSVPESLNITPAFGNAVMSGSLDVLRDLNAFPAAFDALLAGIAPSIGGPFRVTMNDATLRLAGPALELPGGPFAVTMLVEHRKEDLAEGIAGTFFIPSRAQRVISAYVEARAPLVSGRNAFVGVEELEFQLAGRHDDYTTDGATGFLVAGSNAPVVRVQNKFASSNPTVGVRYKPFSSITFRASYGTGFLPPSMFQLAPNAITSVGAGAAIDPRRGNTPTELLQIVSGGNPELRPEDSKSRSAGIIFAPGFARDLRLAVDYTRIDKSDVIISPNLQEVINNEATFPDRIVRASANPGAPFGVGPITFVNQTSLNFTKAEVAALDVSASYRLGLTGPGSLKVFALATRQFHYRTQAALSSPPTENVGITSLFPLKLKANAGLSWERGRWRANWNVGYFSSYQVAASPAATGAPIVANQGGLRVPSQTYHDVSASYRWDLPYTGLSSVQLNLGARNIFNKSPPFDAGNAPYLYSSFGDPRMARYYIGVEAQF